MVVINGKSYSGTSISIINNSLFIDGKLEEKGLSGVVEVKVEGNLTNLTTDGSATVSGSVSGDIKASGSVNCGSVGGDVKAGGSINAGRVIGNLKAGGSITCSR